MAKATKKAGKGKYYTEDVWFVFWEADKGFCPCLDGGKTPYSISAFTRRKEANEVVRGIRECGFKARAVKVPVRVEIREAAKGKVKRGK